jgi:hypothetical protein
LALLDTYNFFGSNQPKSLSGKVNAIRQKAGFHLENIMNLDTRDRMKYLAEKMRMATEFVRGKFSARFEEPTEEQGQQLAGGTVETFLQEINDQASLIYEPKPYPEVITLFKPQRNYDFYSDPQMGWGHLALGGVKIVELPLNPHAMLVEPYVQILARELQVRLTGPQAEKSGSDDGDGAGGIRDLSVRAS